ncbi:MAG TPA: hypothetical protein VKR06_11850 [Ktedonosporobacter sp.]|nr:hypothetical protein [Ktedonosporobacter sp.]
MRREVSKGTVFASQFRKEEKIACHFSAYRPGKMEIMPGRHIIITRMQSSQCLEMEKVEPGPHLEIYALLCSLDMKMYSVEVNKDMKMHNVEARQGMKMYSVEVNGDMKMKRRSTSHSDLMEMCATPRSYLMRKKSKITLS